MSFTLPFETSVPDIRKEWVDNEDGTVSIVSSQDVEPHMDYAKQLANDSAGWSPDKTFRRAAHIPTIIWMKWLREEGWDAYAPENFDKLKRKLNDPDYRYLRTAHWRI